jgi:hypothetical protein
VVADRGFGRLGGLPDALVVQDEELNEQPEGGQDSANNTVLSPQRWGLTPELVDGLPERLRDFWYRYFERFKTKTRNAGEYAYHYLSGLLRLDTKRNYTEIGRATGIAGENIQHFMPNSPWSIRPVLE